jgi:hypothetical protein
MSGLDWIRDLVLAEQKMEETGVVDLSVSNQALILEEQTLDFLRQIKNQFIETAAAFNQLKASSVGTVKIYGISNTLADFMLFRNGFKLIFSMRQPGEIEIYYSLIGSHFLTPTTPEPQRQIQDRDVLRAEWGAFEELKWSYKGLPLKADRLVRHYFSRFIQESAK